MFYYALAFSGSSLFFYTKYEQNKLWIDVNNLTYRLPQVVEESNNNRYLNSMPIMVTYTIMFV